jgi:hypothetical protein
MDPVQRNIRIMELFTLVSYSGGAPETFATRLLRMRSQVRTQCFWEPDEIVNNCPSCGDSFSKLQRKHHCMNCGHIFDLKCMTDVDGQKFGVEEELIVCKTCLNVLDCYQALQVQARIFAEAGPSRQAIDEPPTEASSSEQPQLDSPLYAPISAKIPRFCFAENKFWFIIHAEMEDGKTRELSRYYEDFYDFRVALLTAFPAEAGSTGTQKITLPYMPGPVIMLQRQSLKEECIA